MNKVATRSSKLVGLSFATFASPKARPQTITCWRSHSSFCAKAFNRTQAETSKIEGQKGAYSLVILQDLVRVRSLVNPQGLNNIKNLKLFFSEMEHKDYFHVRNSKP